MRVHNNIPENQDTSLIRTVRHFALGPRSTRTWRFQSTFRLTRAPWVCHALQILPSLLPQLSYQVVPPGQSGTEQTQSLTSASRRLQYGIGILEGGLKVTEKVISSEILCLVLSFVHHIIQRADSLGMAAGLGQVFKLNALGQKTFLTF